jgi:GNAT superfamily N-acetyltransferase
VGLAHEQVSTLRVRAAEEADVPAVVRLLESYMAETLDRRWEGTVEAFIRDGLGAEYQTLVLAVEKDVAGFLCWHRTYDLHHSAIGGEVLEMFVEPRYRGRGWGAALVAEAARQMERAGARFLKAASGPELEELYGRFAVVVPGVQCFLGGSAFREVADLAGSHPRDIVRGLPDRDRNLVE